MATRPQTPMSTTKVRPGRPAQITMSAAGRRRSVDVMDSSLRALQQLTSARFGRRAARPCRRQDLVKAMHRFQPPFPIDADPGEAGPGATAVDIAVLAGSGGVHAQPAGGRDANDGAVQRAFTRTNDTVVAGNSDGDDEFAAAEGVEQADQLCRRDPADQAVPGAALARRAEVVVSANGQARGHDRRDGAAARDREWVAIASQTTRAACTTMATACAPPASPRRAGRCRRSVDPRGGEGRLLPQSGRR